MIIIRHVPGLLNTPCTHCHGCLMLEVSEDGWSVTCLNCARTIYLSNFSVTIKVRGVYANRSSKTLRH